MPDPDENKVANKILLVSYYFPPVKAISSYRNYCLAKYFQKYFDKVEVISTTNSAFLPKEKLTLEDVKVNRALTIDYRTFFHSKKSSGVVDNGSKAHRKTRGLKNSFPFNLLLDLGGIFYIFFGILIGIYRIKRNKYTHILSSFHPYADHIIAWVLKLLYPSIYWIADFNNLHMEPDTNPLVWPRFQKKINRLIISNANAVSTVSEGLVPHLEAFNDNIIVLENGIDAFLQHIVPKKQEKFTISYTGSLYPHQSIKTLLHTINHLIEHHLIDKEKIRLQYAGASNALWNKWVSENNLESINIDLGVISIKNCQEVIANSQVNLLLSWTTPNLKGILPGKFYEYLSVKQPILLIINGEEDKLWEAKFDALRCGTICYEKDLYTPELADFILELYQDWNHGVKTPFKINETEVDKYLWANSMPEFLEKIGSNKIVKPKKNMLTPSVGLITKSNKQSILIRN